MGPLDRILRLVSIKSQHAESATARSIAASEVPALPATRSTIEAPGAGASRIRAVDIIVGGEIGNSNKDKLRAWGAIPVRGQNLTDICETVYEIVNRSRASERDVPSSGKNTSSSGTTSAD